MTIKRPEDVNQQTTRQQQRTKATAPKDSPKPDVAGDQRNALAMHNDLQTWGRAVVQAPNEELGQLVQAIESNRTKAVDTVVDYMTKVQTGQRDRALLAARLQEYADEVAAIDPNELAPVEYDIPVPSFTPAFEIPRALLPGSVAHAIAVI